jgi:hypothetical protein
VEKIVTEIIIDRDANGSTTILSSTTTVTLLAAPPVWVTHTLTASEVKYGILTLGAKSTPAQFFSPGAPLDVECGGLIYHGAVHASTRGRVDGLTALLRSDQAKFSPGAAISLNYDTVSSVLRIA